ncbi:hypothetical protein E2320_000210 [Naja naja]|nr:hypothetical protein E2320_000210 [Naja naja]
MFGSISKGTPLREGANEHHIGNNPQAFSGLQQAMQLWVSLADGQRAAVKEEVCERVLGGIAQREKLWAAKLEAV